jgi:hypothetical protein
LSASGLCANFECPVCQVWTFHYKQYINWLFLEKKKKKKTKFWGKWNDYKSKNTAQSPVIEIHKVYEVRTTCPHLKPFCNTHIHPWHTWLCHVSYLICVLLPFTCALCPLNSSISYIPVLFENSSLKSWFNL